MDVLVTCKYKEDPIKNRGTRVFTTTYANFSDAQGQITLESVVVSGQNSNSSKLSCMSSNDINTLCNLYLFASHFYIIFLIIAHHIVCGYTLEPPH